MALPNTDIGEVLVQRTIRIDGRVQGVGFRPLVWRLATALGLTGRVFNLNDAVVIQCRGEEKHIHKLLEMLQANPPLQSKISAVQQQPYDGSLDTNVFRIDSSLGTHQPRSTVLPDLAPCADCVEELFGGTDRRSSYPFTHCTQCGPRFSLIHAIPFDRSNTSLAGFAMCELCNEEYCCPEDRRFHAQTNLCPQCGPSLSVVNSYNEMVDGDAIGTIEQCIKRGGIVAIKGVGGFQFVVDATNVDAVQRLRLHKQRPHKPLALMLRDIAMVKNYCQLSELEQDLMVSPAAPIVVLKRHTTLLNKVATLADNIAPQLSHLGVMLPSSPLHHLLLSRFDVPLVMTSGNAHGAPQSIDNQKAIGSLQSIADLFLLHNRDILNRVDDSLIQVIDDKPQAIRIARGYAPLSLPIPDGFQKGVSVLAMGGDLKNNFCVLQKNTAVLSQYLGDLHNASSLQEYKNCIDQYRRMFQFQADIIALDAHPHYHSARVGHDLAQALQLPLCVVQHHHAHMAACLGENGWPLSGQPVLGVTLDGLGYSAQTASLWGGEILIGNYREVKRVACLKPVALPGGDAAMAQPWRNSVAQLQAALGWNAVIEQYGNIESLHSIGQQPVQTILAMIENGINAPLSSSCGRLFDAVAAVLGVFNHTHLSYEGQGAMVLESCMDEKQWQQADPYPFLVVETAEFIELDPASMWRALLRDLSEGNAVGAIAAGFHKGLAKVLSDCVVMLGQQHGITTVALSGGVFQNAHLTSLLGSDLRARNMNVLTHQKLPANDGGIAFGQSLVAAAQGQHQCGVVPCA